uniref:Uncharacterized protein n=1 Tax=Cacopsylla melanoneura TaxID=428564 RepID=A0A8D8ZDK4_9HEMI
MPFPPSIVNDPIKQATERRVQLEYFFHIWWQNASCLIHNVVRPELLITKHQLVSEHSILKWHTRPNRGHERSNVRVHLETGYMSDEHTMTIGGVDKAAHVFHHIEILAGCGA